MNGQNSNGSSTSHEPDAATIEQGRAAWQRINTATTFDSWKLVALAVGIGRQHALREARVNKPFGKKYAVSINRWLEANGFLGMPYYTRAACCSLADHLEEIEVWRAGLPDRDRAAQNHPEVVMRSWRRRQTDDRPAPHFVKSAMPSHKHGRPVYFGQEMLRRAAMALRETNSNDIFVLARCALEAAIRTENDLIDLLNTEKPRHQAAVAAHVAA